jgi:DNA-directed RNA polymerase subunit F
VDVSFERHDLERLRRSIVLLAPRHPGGLDREAAMAVVEELQRMQDKDRRVYKLVDQAPGSSTRIRIPGAFHRQKDRGTAGRIEDGKTAH